MVSEWPTFAKIPFFRRLPFKCAPELCAAPSCSRLKVTIAGRCGHFVTQRITVRASRSDLKCATKKTQSPHV